MNKILSTIFTTIILINFSMASGNTVFLENALKKIEAEQAAHEAGFQIPTSYSACGDEALSRSVDALTMARKKHYDNVNLDVSLLKSATCEYSVVNGITWSKLSYVNADNLDCTSYVVFKWITPNKKNKDKQITFELQQDYTSRANEGLVCQPRIETPKIQIDETTKIQIDETPKIQIDEAPKIQIDETLKPVVQRFGPLRRPLASRPQNDKLEATNTRADLSIDEDEISDSVQETLDGGWVECEKSDFSEAPRVIAMLIAQEKIDGVTVYTQNVTKCQKQLVNGMNFNVVISLNKKSCQVAYHQAINGEVSLLTTGHEFEGIDLCTRVFSPRK